MISLMRQKTALERVPGQKISTRGVLSESIKKDHCAGRVALEKKTFWGKEFEVTDAKVTPAHAIFAPCNTNAPLLCSCFGPSCSFATPVAAQRSYITSDRP